MWRYRPIGVPLTIENKPVQVRVELIAPVVSRIVQVRQATSCGDRPQACHRLWLLRNSTIFCYAKKLGLEQCSQKAPEPMASLNAALLVTTGGFLPDLASVPVTNF